MSAEPPVQSVVRAFALFAEVNRLGTATIAELHRRTRIPKPTIVRLLNTLIAENYVIKDRRLGGYQVTGNAEVLSSGFHGAPLVIQIARSRVNQLTQSLKWPTAVCMLDNDGVVVRYSTIPDSPMSPFHSTIGMKLSLGTRAMGRAYLAFCPPDELEYLIEAMRTSTDPENKFASRQAMDDMIAATRLRGWAVRDRGIEPEAIGTVAVPIMRFDRVVATMGVSFFHSAMAHDEHLRIFAAVSQAAGEIGRELEMTGTDARLPSAG